MRRHILFPVVGGLMMGALAACTQEVPELPSSELYTREWVKSFGVINPSQDWNNAVRGSVHVSVDGTSAVEVTTKIGGKHYLLGRYENVSGACTLDFDMPRGVNDILVGFPGNRVATRVGGSVTLLSQTEISGPSGISAEVCKDRSDWMVVPMLNATIFRRKMPEGCYNADRDGVNVDFALRFTQNDIIIRPLFWHTKNDLEFGLFYVDEASGEPVRFPLYKMEKNTTNSSPDDLILCWAPTETRSVTVKDFLHDDTFLECLANHGITTATRHAQYVSYEFITINSLDNFEVQTSSVDDRNMTQACREYLDKIGIKNDLTLPEDSRFHYVYRWRTVGDNIRVNNGNVYDETLAGNNKNPRKDLEIVYTIFKFDYDNAKGWGGENQMNKGIKMDDENYPALISKGIKVHIDDITKSYGGYIKHGEKYMYSLSRFNEFNRWFPAPGAERNNLDYADGMPVWKYNPSDFILDKNRRAYRAVTWVGTKYSWRYMAFEDGEIPDKTYNPSDCDFDMQDFVFLVEPADVVVDIPDDPEPVPVKWLVACEDLGSKDDFDFNDVVFEVEHVSGQSKAKITPLAAGGTLELYLKRNGEYAHPSGKIEWHELFGVYDYTQMINTRGITHTAKSFYIDVPADFSMASSTEGAADADGNYRTNMGGFHLEVVREDGKVDGVTPPGPGEAPQMLLIFQAEGKPWCWPIERHHITLGYRAFKEWMNTPGYEIKADGTDWFEQAVRDHVVARK